MNSQQIVWRKVTLDVVRAIYQMSMERKTKKQIADALGVSVDIVKQVRNNRYSCSDPAITAEIERLFATKDAQQGGETGGKPASVDSGNTNPASDPFNGSKWAYSQPARKLAPAGWNPAEAVPSHPGTQPEPPEEPMLLQNTALSPQAKKHFGLMRNPFQNDVQCQDDVYQTTSVRYARAALLDAAMHHGFVAIVGESGAGKSTMAEDLEERIKAEGREITVIKPYVLGMELNDEKGKTLKSGHIAEAITHALDPSAQLKSSPEARFRQLHDLLKASRRAGRHHLLLLEEAHCLPIATLKHLKRFLELKDGLARQVGIALVAQPELRQRLNSQNPEVREVMQRCEMVELEPLNDELEGYLRHKLDRACIQFDKVFAPDAMDAIRARLIYMPRNGRPADARSMCYPLVVNNLAARAMNAAALVCWPKVDAQVIAGC